MTNIGLENRRKQLLRGSEDAMAKQAHGAVVTNTNSLTEEIVYSAGRVGSQTPITHPYLGPNSWLRIMPEKGTKILIDKRAEDGEPYISAYVRESGSKQQTAATEDNRFYYRALREGEINLTSPGIADVFTSLRGTLELKGGSTMISLEAENLKISHRAPTHTISILGNKRSKLGDEQRFGVVTRSGAAVTNPLLAQPTVEQIIENLPGYYAKEYIRIIRSDGPIDGVTLIDHREGDVYDDKGKQLKCDVTGKKLRSRTQYGTSTVPGTSTNFEVDENGNVVVTLTNVSAKGAVLDTGIGSLTLTIGKDIIADIKQNVIAHITQKLDIEAKETAIKNEKNLVSDADGHEFNSKKKVLVTGKNFVSDTDFVDLVTGADQHMVRGEDLIKWLTQHTHPTSTGPSGPPIKPPTPPDFLSQKAKLK